MYSTPISNRRRISYRNIGNLESDKTDENSETETYDASTPRNVYLLRERKTPKAVIRRRPCNHYTPSKSVSSPAPCAYCETQKN